MYKTIRTLNKTFVIKESVRNVNYTDGSEMPEANFLNTGMALCGILKKGETLDEWERRR